jgi:hypothetical protein
VSDSIYNGPAFKAASLRGRSWRGERPGVLAGFAQPREQGRLSRRIQPLIVADDYDQTCTVNYRNDQRYPHSVRDASKPYPDELLKPLTRQD